MSHLTFFPQVSVRKRKHRIISFFIEFPISLILIWYYHICVWEWYDNVFIFDISFMLLRECMKLGALAWNLVVICVGQYVVLSHMSRTCSMCVETGSWGSRGFWCRSEMICVVHMTVSYCGLEYLVEPHLHSRVCWSCQLLESLHLFHVMFSVNHTGIDFWYGAYLKRGWISGLHIWFRYMCKHNSINWITVNTSDSLRRFVCKVWRSHGINDIQFPAQSAIVSNNLFVNLFVIQICKKLQAYHKELGNDVAVEWAVSLLY